MAIEFREGMFPEQIVVERITNKWLTLCGRVQIALFSLNTYKLVTTKPCSIDELEQILSKMKELQGENK